MSFIYSICCAAIIYTEATEVPPQMLLMFMYFIHSICCAAIIYTEATEVPPQMLLMFMYFIHSICCAAIIYTEATNPGNERRTARPIYHPRRRATSARGHMVQGRVKGLQFTRKMKRGRNFPCIQYTTTCPLWGLLNLKDHNSNKM